MIVLRAFIKIYICILVPNYTEKNTLLIVIYEIKFCLKVQREGGESCLPWGGVFKNPLAKIWNMQLVLKSKSTAQ